MNDCSYIYTDFIQVNFVCILASDKKSKFVKEQYYNIYNNII